MKNLKFLPKILSIMFALACFSVSVAAQTTDENGRLAAVSGSGTSVRWDVSAQYVSLALRVSAPDGLVIRRDFKAGEPVEITLIDREGNRLPDGVYNYELRLTPEVSADVRKAMTAARAKVVDDDDQAPTRDMVKRGLLSAEPLVQSGAFTMLKGSVVVAGGSEDGRAAAPTGARKGSVAQARSTRPGVSTTQGGVMMLAAHAVEQDPPRISWKTLAALPFPAEPMPDQVIPDDLIVQGSLCVGFDCVNNEPFGFDTIRLKENNTRILFDDTSTSAGYPANDWQLTANDSASGGTSKFSIEDITGAKVPFTVEAGASTNSIYVDSTGRVGLRTSTPVLDVHTNTSNTPAIRLEQNNSGGFTAQTWDIGANEANFFIRDVTGGSKLSLRIRPGAPTSSLDINSAGHVGINTTNPVFDGNAVRFLAVDGGSGSFAEIGAGGGQSATDGNLGTIAFYNSSLITTEKRNSLILGSNDGATNSGNLRFITASAGTLAEKMRIGANGRVGIGTTAPTDTLSVSGTASKTGGGSWSVFSDERLKNIKGNFNAGLKAVMQLQPLRYEYKSDNALSLKSDGEHVGFGAQAVQKIIPEAVTKTDTGYLQINNDPILWAMLNAIKEQQKEIEQLKAQVQQLQSRPAARARARQRRR
ncbi:MAG TPA: tail fiber domain-containing protein [Pyrinomonadaceae bacterium]|nr:tail fiber domain-containing protein [Pyrinomonadaceae bacterium]